jgi:acetyl-CoA synthetase
MNFITARPGNASDVEYVDSLPGRSGKIMRRVLHAREWGEPVGDISTLESD